MSKFYRSLRTSLTVTVMAVFAVTSTVAAQVDNPQLSDACGVDIALLLDMSGSINTANAVDTVKDAGKAFSDAFLPETPSLVGVVEFSDGTASEVQDLTDDQATVETAIDGLSASGNTNWEAALLAGTAMLTGGSDRNDADHPDLMVMFTDGEPNRPSGSALSAAEAAADAAKNAGIRIVTVGVAGATEGSLITISGSNVANDPGDITIDTDVVLTDFDGLADALANLASSLCEDADCGCLGPVISVNKNSAFVGNHVYSNANTGDNYAGGADSGRGGSAGDIENRGGDVERSSTGNGGAGGSISGANAGGYVSTGNATSDASVVNVVNSNVTRVSGGSSFVFSYNRNRATTFNTVGAGATSGDNAATGADAGSGGSAGDIDSSGHRSDVEDSTTGAGGRGGNISGAAAGGTVFTGHANSTSSVINQINFSNLRVR